MTTETDTRAEDQARAQLEGIMEMVKRVEHCQDCEGGEDCELTTEEIYAGINLWYSEADKINNNQATEEEREEYHNEDLARQSIEEDPLSVEVRSDWHTPGGDSEATEYMILLCTGGPAVRVTGDLGSYSQPKTATIEYQDWFTPWERLVPLTDEEHDALLTFAQQFFFGE